MSSYLLNRNGNYHVRIRIPSDLTGIIPATELVKSLKTRDIKTAEVAALPYRQGILKAFSLLRYGYITVEQARDSIDRVLKRKCKATPATALVPSPVPVCGSSPAAFAPSPCTAPPLKPPLFLSNVIEQFLNDRKHGWAPKTEMENAGSYHLILDILGDIDVSHLDRLVVRDLRDKLMRLPANLYKMLPKQTARNVLKKMQDSPVPGFSPMSITTVNKHISRFSSLMKHCMKEGYIAINPATGLKIKQKRRPDEERKAYL